jgi:hypothetical protein
LRRIFREAVDFGENDKIINLEDGEGLKGESFRVSKDGEGLGTEIFGVVKDGEGLEGELPGLGEDEEGLGTE